MRRLVAPPNRGPGYWWSWAATAGVAAIAAVVRLVGLAEPKGKIFDEVYYATEAWALLQRGVEWDLEKDEVKYVVHPPLGKWLIALGEKAFGYDEFGWRISAAVAGIVSVVLLARIGRRLFRSTVLGCAAGLLMALDGFHMVLSRVALLDIFLMLFLLAAFGALLRDRDARRGQWLAALASGVDAERSGPARGLRGVPWWRLLAAVLLGAALAVKWSALFFVPALLVMVLWWDAATYRTAGATRPWRRALRDGLIWLPLCGLVVFAVYLASWSGWLLSDDGYYRHWLASEGRSEPAVVGALQNLLHYHQEALNFHSGLSSKHTYQSWPWQWLLLGRPVAFYWSGDGPCGAASCAAEVLLLGTPLLWWSFLPALGALTWLGVARRDWRAGAIGLGVAAGLLPWFYYAFQSRTMFSFYALPSLPFLVLAVCYVIGALIGRAGTDEAPARRRVGAVVAGAYVLAVAVCFAWYYPVFVGTPIPYEDWQLRMLLGDRWV
ncbi:dolichyl-phosphate-mannose--protein mannosyltransferase [Pilimelia columellifera]|uniref:Polyprenol-phosphate-mannose--protein mannosyltransferase n=1 Tax=Pilimelia columellifera subsp. columellifera TaxID=706583 RepID=A0ABN3NG10_9ACTN